MRKLKHNVSLLWHSLFSGMAAADSVIHSPQIKDSSVIEIQKEVKGGVFSDMLQEKETKQVIEMRDKYYRVLKEADKWSTSNIDYNVDDDGNIISINGTNRLRKKRKEDFEKHVIVFNEENLPIRTIQDNKKIQKHSNFYVDLSENMEDFDTTITITRDGITPRFNIEKYAKKVVVREKDERAYVDLYFPTEASQFGKTDAILISNLYKIWEEKNFRSDLTDFISIEWYSDKGWNTDDVCLFKYDDVKFIGTNIFDGNFVLTFDCNVVNNGSDLTEKYKTKELDYKYENDAPKNDAIDIFTLSRKIKEKDKKEIDLTNLNSTTFKIS